MNALADYAKHISSELVLFYWAYVRSIFVKHNFLIFFCACVAVIVAVAVVCLFVVAAVVVFVIGIN